MSGKTTSSDTTTSTAVDRVATAPLRYKPWWIALGTVCVLAIVYLSLTPNPLPGHDLGGANLNHVFAYGVTALWFAQLREEPGIGIWTPIGLCAMGIALEFAQALTGSRHFSYADMASNAAGVALGLFAGQPLRGRLLPALERLLRPT